MDVVLVPYYNRIANMIKKVSIVSILFVVVSVMVFVLSAALDPAVSLPQQLNENSPCPAVGCASGTCHDFDEIPLPDGINTMNCPEASCASVDCHAWDTLVTRYYQPSDMSLNLWILVPVVVVVGLVVLVKKL